MSQTLSISFAANNSSFTSRISDWALQVMDALGGLGIALLIALESIFPPIPSEAILPLAGYSASQGQINVFAATIWATFGSLVGSLVLFYVGSILGRERVVHWGEKLPFVKMADINKAEKWFLKHEGRAVFFGRMIPIVRSMISLPAGIEKMSLPIFVLYSLAGSAIWNSALISAGYFLGNEWQIVESFFSTFQYVVIATFIGAISLFVYKRSRKKNLQSR